MQPTEPASNGTSGTRERGDDLEEGTLWYVLSGSDGARNRAHILGMLDARSRTVTQLADGLGVVPNTVRHHLDVLAEKGLVTGEGRSYAETYVLTECARANWSTVERIIDAVAEA